LLCIYDSFFWLDEFDPKFLHLGRGRGDFSKVNAAKVHVHLREFDDGRYQWGGPETQAIAFDALRVSVFSKDDKTPIKSIHSSSRTLSVSSLCI